MIFNENIKRTQVLTPFKLLWKSSFKHESILVPKNELELCIFCSLM